MMKSEKIKSKSCRFKVKCEDVRLGRLVNAFEDKDGDDFYKFSPYYSEKEYNENLMSFYNTSYETYGFIENVVGVRIQGERVYLLPNKVLFYIFKNFELNKNANNEIKSNVVNLKIITVRDEDEFIEVCEEIGFIRENLMLPKYFNYPKEKFRNDE